MQTRRNSTGALRAGPASALAACWTLLGAARALACPDCVVGRVARSQVWGEDFAQHLAVSLLPFLIIAALSLWLDRRSTPQ